MSRIHDSSCSGFTQLFPMRAGFRHRLLLGNPPSWVFGPVWTVLYLMMAIAAWIVWRQRGFKEAAGALGILALQLALNAAYSPLFFGLRNPLAGLVDIIPLWAAIMATIVSFWKISPLAGALLVPYWLWVGFATALNFMIWRLNP